MRKMLRLPALGLVVLVVAMVALVVFAPRAAVGAAAPVDDLTVNRLEQNGTAAIFIKMAVDANLDGAESITDRVARRNYVYDTLTAHADANQKSVRAFLDRRGVYYEPHWINNSIYVPNADAALVNALAGRTDVAYIRGEYSVPLHQPVAISEAPERTERAPEWGITMINADDVWNQGNRGAGIVVANNDTGVRYTHDAIDGQYRGVNGDHNYDWWDPQSGSGSQTTSPNDQNGHGTHTMGTMVGDDGGSNQIGVAPQATWIASKGCSNIFCTDNDLIESAEFLECPTDLNGNNANCSLGADIINNSWGGGGGDNWYQSYVNSWIAAGILPVFSAGNSGSNCNTMGSPGDYKNVIGVGAVDINRVLAYFSSKGPGVFVNLKPQVTAPGENVRSSYNTSDNAYANLSGTSMAAPHTAGTMALLMADTPGQSLQTYVGALFNNTSQSGLGAPPGPDSCGGRNYNVFPNAIYGHGLIDALAAVNDLP
jgi:subtilisin family serine protease